MTKLTEAEIKQQELRDKIIELCREYGYAIQFGFGLYFQKIEHELDLQELKDICDA